MIYKLKDGREIEIRGVKITDANGLIEYMKKALNESSNLMREPHEWRMSVEEEEKFLKNMINSNDNFMYVALYRGMIIGNTGIQTRDLDRVRHRSYYGISVLKEFHHQGVGTLLTKLIIEKAIELNKTKIDLTVRKDNINAIKLYEKLGFNIEGEIQRGFKVKGEYINLVVMGKLL